MTSSASCEFDYFDIKRFTAKINKTETCWIWVGALDRLGYGNFWFKGKNWLAHRIAYLLYTGPILNGLHVLHNCDTRRCVNPKHLRLGTHAENMQDKVFRGRSKRGSLAKTAKYTETQIIEVFELREQGLKHREISAKTGIPMGLIGNVLTGKHWSWLRKKWSIEQSLKTTSN